MTDTKEPSPLLSVKDALIMLRDVHGTISQANADRIADTIDRLTAERDVLLGYYRASRAMETTTGYPDATVDDERRVETAYNKATDDVQSYLRKSAAIAKEKTT